MTDYDAATTAILKAVESNLRKMAGEGSTTILTVNMDEDPSDYAAKAASASDPILAQQYRKLAKRAEKKRIKRVKP